MKKFKWFETIALLTIVSLMAYILYWGFRFIFYAWTI
jgi:hypothetical protein